MVLLERRVAFSAGHRYWLDSLSEPENRARFGRWASPRTHGHNYILWAAVAGPVDPENGMVVNIKRVDDELQSRVVQRLNLCCFNDDIRHFSTVPPTLENILFWLAEELADLPGGGLKGLRLHETEDLFAEWSPDMPAEIIITRSYEFAAAHRLGSSLLSDEENLRLFGKCTWPNYHGHNYVLEVSVRGIPDSATGMAIRLEDLDEAVQREVLDRYDHRNLNLDVEELEGRVTTSEVVVQAIFDRLKTALPGLCRVRLFETPRSCFEASAG
jgi:6-pyruvoyltetrahydropterin/6-carboxytetrahydropterin synthase